MEEQNPDRLLEAGWRLHSSGDLEGAREQLQAAVALYRGKLGDGKTVFRGRLAEALEALSKVENASDRNSIAEAYIREAVTIRRAATHGGMQHHRAGLAICLREAGELKIARKEARRAVVYASEAAGLLTELVMEDEAAYSSSLEDAYYTLGRAFSGTRQWMEAADAWGQCAQVCRRALEIKGTSSRRLDNALRWKSEAEREAGANRARIETLRELVAVREVTCAAPGATWECRRTLAETRGSLGSLLGVTIAAEGGPEASFAPAVRCLALATEEFDELYAEDPVAIGSTAWLWYELAWYQSVGGAIADARQTLNRLRRFSDAGSKEAKQALNSGELDVNEHARRHSRKMNYG